MRKAIIRQSDGRVVNVIEIEAKANWKPPDDCQLADAKDGSPGDTWDGTKFIKPETIVPEPVRDLLAEIDTLEARIKRLESL